MTKEEREKLLSAMKESMSNVESQAKKAQQMKVEEKKQELSIMQSLPRIVEDLKKFGTIHQDTVAYSPKKFNFTSEEFNSAINFLFNANKASWDDGTGLFSDVKFPRGEMVFQFKGTYFKIILLIGQGSSYTLVLLPDGEIF